MFFVISSTKLWRFWWNLVHRFVNKFASKWCKCFPPRLNNVSTLPCETWNAYRTRATLELLQKKTPEFIPPQLWPPNSPDLNLVDCSMSGLLQEKVYKTRVIDLHELKQRQSGAIRTGLCRHCGSHSSVASLIAPEQWCVFCTPSLATFLTCCNQLDSNLENLEATVEVEWILEFLSVTTRR